VPHDDCGHRNRYAHGPTSVCGHALPRLSISQQVSTHPHHHTRRLLIGVEVTSVAAPKMIGTESLWWEQTDGEQYASLPFLYFLVMADSELCCSTFTVRV
jgi:hypothetical protein